MKYYIKLFIKGFFIGIAKIIPGVSGSLLAIMLNVYDVGLNAITNYFKDIKKNSLIIFFLATGVIFSITIFSKIIYILLDKYYFITMMFFLGIISNGYKEISKNITITKKNIIIIIFAIIISSFLLSININYQLVLSNEINNYFIFFIGGIMESFGSIVPALSSSSFLMIMGIYNIILFLVSNIYNISLILSSLNIIIPFILGMLLGLIIIARLIIYLLNKHQEKTYLFILGIYISTYILLIIKLFSSNNNIITIFLGFIFFLIGLILTNIVEL